MEKRDILIVVAGVAIVIAMAFFIKPAMTGKQPDLSIPFLEPEPTVTPATLPTPYPSQTQRTTTVPTPSAVPTWSGQSKDLGFVAPPVTSYSPTVTPTHITPPEVTPEQDVMVTYATIEGRSGGITETLTMPFPYWELEYTVSPWEDRFVGTTSSKPAGVAESFGAEVFPSFSIEVVNADDRQRSSGQSNRREALIPIYGRREMSTIHVPGQKSSMKEVLSEIITLT